MSLQDRHDLFLRVGLVKEGEGIDKTLFTEINPESQQA
jgi:hypothetical protein